ncbi:MAG: hypothetical protein LBT10_04130 [Methanobrevibacter sp.]|jgi:hypothetical protein|nr:hypothetical protein [Methanobrevibacter sp.]
MQKNKTKLSYEEIENINKKINEYNEKYNGNIVNLTTEEIENYKKKINELFEDETGYRLTNIPPEIAIEMVEDFKTRKTKSIAEYVDRFGSFCKELKKENVDPIKIVLKYLVNYRSPKKSRNKSGRGANNPNIGLAAPDLLELIRHVAKEVNNPIYELTNQRLGIKVGNAMKKYYRGINNLDQAYRVKPSRYFLNKHNKAELSITNETIKTYPRLRYTVVCDMDYIKEKFLE